MRIAAPAACTIRVAISTSGPGAAAQSADAAVKSRQACAEQAAVADQVAEPARRQQERREPTL